MISVNVDGIGEVTVSGVAPFSVVKNNGSADIIDAEKNVITPDVNGNPNVIFARLSDAQAVVDVLNAAAEIA